MKHCLFIFLGIFFSTVMIAQGTSSLAVSDSLDIPGQHVRYYGALNHSSPVILLSEGLFMPRENIWYYKPADTSVRIHNFTFSAIDTSLYLFSSIRGKLYLLRIKKNGEESQIQTNLMQLPFGSSYQVIPVEKDKYYLAQTDTAFHLFKVIAGKVEKAYETKSKVMTVCGIDTALVLINYKDRISTVIRKKERVLFKSELPIQNFAISPSGKIYISTHAGIFLVNQDLGLSRLALQVDDGILKTSGNTLFVLSNNNKKIYLVNL